MTVYRKSMGLLPDNEENYFSLLSAVIESVDEFSVMVIVRNPKDYHFKISPSEAIYISPIIKEVNNLNNVFGLRVDFSKSMKNSASIDFSLKF